MKRIVLSALFALFCTSICSAGNINASIRGGNLYLEGDRFSSTVAVDSPSPTRVRVVASVASSGEATTINGGSKPTLILNGWTSGIYYYAYEGDDRLTISNLTSNGAVVIDQGDGDDELYMGIPTAQTASELLESNPGILTSAHPGPVSLNQSLLVLGTRGNDLAFLGGTDVTGYVTIDMGSEDDTLYIGEAVTVRPSVNFKNGATIVLGEGSDEVDIQSLNVAYDLTVDDSTSPLTLGIFDTQIGGSVFVYGTPSNDSIETNALVIRRLFKVISEGGADAISLQGASEQIEIYSGLGNDTVSVDNFTSNRLTVFLDPGQDNFYLNRVDIDYVNLYGSSENDLFNIQGSILGEVNIYGESGTDTYRSGIGNTIKKISLFSIERR